MPRGFPTKTVTFRLTANEQAALARFAAIVGQTPQSAAHRAMVLGLVMQTAVTQPLGSHCLLPGDLGGLLVFSAGRNDAARVQAVIDCWNSK